MKAILVSVILLFLAADLYIPEGFYLRTIGRKQVPVCSIVYDVGEDAYVFEDSLANCTVIEVRSIPPLAVASIPVKARFVKGSYSLMVPKTVGLEVGYDFEIEDLLTGTIYNLKSTSPYTFNVSRTIPDRFVMHVKKSGVANNK